ncbi:MAG: DNA ligase [Methylococcaceae bacterium]
MLHSFYLLIFTFISFTCHADSTTPPPLTLAKTYKGQINLTHYWLSEKLDGVRAYWNGQQLISRQGNPYPAPRWFIKEFPEQALDGELWLERSHFQQLLSFVSKNQAIDKEWQQISYYVFDMPQIEKPFSNRLERLKQLVKSSNSPYLKLVHQYRVTDSSDLTRELNQVVAAGGEGLMLHRADALYHIGRNDDVLKVKPYYDAEATVIAHIPGKGKFSGMLGSIQVEMPGGIQFRIGSGFSNQQRRTPPAIGSIITYSYHGKTDKGIPRFASFLRIRSCKEGN